MSHPNRYESEDMAHEITCPAAAEIHPVTSPNDMDIHCRIAGHLRPAEGSPCCGAYADCNIWRAEQDRVRFGRIGRTGGETQVPRTRQRRRVEEVVGPSL